MFRINPGEAQTDLYGINKGAAQVIDLSPLRRQNELAIAQQQKEAEAKRLREEKLISDISALDKSKIRPNDLEHFQNLQKGIYDDVKKAYSESKGGVLPIDKQIEFESRLADVKQQALLSADRKAQATDLLKQAILHPDLFNRQEELDALQAELYSPEKSASKGGLQNDIPSLTKHFDYGQYVNDKLAPWAQEQAKRRDNRGVYSNTPEERTQMIVDDLADPIKMNQAEYDFKTAKNKLGTDNPIDYYVKKYADKLKVDVKPKLAEWEVYGGGGGSSKNNDIRVTHTMKDDSEEYSVQDPKTNEEVVVIKKDGKVVGGLKGGRLTPAEKSERDKAISANNKAIADYQKRLNDLKKRAVEDGLTPEEVEAELPMKPTMIPVPFKEKGVEIDATEAQKLAYNKYGVNIEDLSKGKPGNIQVQPVDARTKKENPKQDTSSGGKIRVKRKSDGKTGTIDEKDFNPSKYDKI